jgi:hypothetical protein
LLTALQLESVSHANLAALSLEKRLLSNAWQEPYSCAFQLSLQELAPSELVYLPSGQFLHPLLSLPVFHWPRLLPLALAQFWHVNPGDVLVLNT